MGFLDVFNKQEKKDDLNVVEETLQPAVELFSPSIVQQAEQGSVVGKYDQNIYNKLSIAITKQDLEGDDYLEFKSSLKKLAAYIPEEEKLYKATFESLDLSVETLLKSLEYYIDVVEGEKAKFKNDLSGAVEEQVGKKEQELLNLIDKKENLSSQIIELEKQIIELDKYEITLKANLHRDRTKLMITDANFTVTADKLTKKLITDMDRIKKHLITEKSTK